MKDRNGRYLRKLRLACGLSLKDVAEKIFVSYKTVSAWELDRCKVDSTQLYTLAELYGEDPSVFINTYYCRTPDGKHPLEEVDEDTPPLSDESVPTAVAEATGDESATAETTVTESVAASTPGETNAVELITENNSTETIVAESVAENNSAKAETAIARQAEFSDRQAKNDLGNFDGFLKSASPDRPKWQKRHPVLWTGTVAFCLTLALYAVILIVYLMTEKINAPESNAYYRLTLNLLLEAKEIIILLVLSCIPTVLSAAVTAIKLLKQKKRRK